MDINVVFTLSNGGEYKNTTSDFLSLDDCQQEIVRFVRDETGSLTFAEPSGAKTIIPARHVVSVRLVAVGGR